MALRCKMDGLCVVRPTNLGFWSVGGWDSHIREPHLAPLPFAATLVVVDWDIMHHCRRWHRLRPRHRPGLEHIILPWRHHGRHQSPPPSTPSGRRRCWWPFLTRRTYSTCTADQILVSLPRYLLNLPLPNVLSVKRSSNVVMIIFLCSFAVRHRQWKIYKVARDIHNTTGEKNTNRTY